MHTQEGLVLPEHVHVYAGSRKVGPARTVRKPRFSPGVRCRASMLYSQSWWEGRAREVTFTLSRAE